MKSVIRLLLSIVLFIGLAACQVSKPAQSEKHGSRVLIINSDATVPRYKVAEAAFSRTLNHPGVENVDLHGDQLPIETLLDTLKAQRPNVIYCIGAKALGSIQYIAPDIPVVYSSVLSWRQFLDQPDYYGVTSEIAPAAQLAWFKHFFPDIKRIGVLSSDANRDLIEEAREAGSMLSLTLITEIISNDNRKDQAERLLSQVDALWILPDPIVLDSQPHTVSLFELSHQAKVPVFGYHPVFMEFGATMTISADLATTGRQAALIVQSVLEQQTRAASIQFPAGSDISLNLRKVQDYKLQLNPEALNSVNDLLNQ